MVTKSMMKKQNYFPIPQESQFFEKLKNSLISDNNEDSLVLPQCNFSLTKEQDCRQDLSDYEALLQAYMNLQHNYSQLCTENNTLWKVIRIIVKIKLRSQRSKLSHAASLKPLKRDSMSFEIYAALLKAAKGSTYSKIRLRVAFCILFVTGIKLKVLLSLRVHQLTTLREKGWIAVDEYSIEPTNSKAHLTEIGRMHLKDREEDFTSLFLDKMPNDFIFTSKRNPQTRLSRETLTREINKVMSRVSQELIENPKITIYSFRVGAITEIWENPTVIKYIQKILDIN